MKAKPKIIVEIDNRSGFCFGVVNAINKAEAELKTDETLYCLGEIVHNSKEVERLEKLGLRAISHDDIQSLKGKKVLLRAHGEPPETYRQLSDQGIEVIDASCPVVLKLQKKIRGAWEGMRDAGGVVVIFGKQGHAEVIGLVGQTQGNAVVLESFDEIDKLDFSKPMEIFAQTTKGLEDYKEMVDEIKARMENQSNGKDYHLKIHSSICGQVSNRKKEILNFAKNHDLILFVSGKNSSNGKMLFDVCQSVNNNSHFISTSEELIADWFYGAESVGICGATSTPRWLMEKVAETVMKITQGGEELNFFLNSRM